MELVSTPWHVVSSVLIFWGGLIFLRAFCTQFDLTFRRLTLLYIWHTMLCVAYAVYVLTYGGDSEKYYRIASSAEVEFSVGTNAVNYVAAYFVKGLDLSFLGTFLLFNVLGSAGLIAFDASLRSVTTKGNEWLTALIVFLPSVSFWSSALGKDAISFMATGLGLWAALQLSKRIWLMALAVILMLSVRPHMAALMVMGVVAVPLLEHRLALIQRIIILVLAVAGATALVPFALAYSKLENIDNIDSIVRYIEIRQMYNMHGGGGINVSAMSLPMQLFTYMFRPLPFEAHSFFAFISSLDNTLLLFVFLVGGIRMFWTKGILTQNNRALLWTYALVAWPILAMTTANLGIAVRQKWMFAPMLLYLMVVAINTPYPMVNYHRHRVRVIQPKM